MTLTELLDSRAEVAHDYSTMVRRLAKPGGKVSETIKASPGWLDLVSSLSTLTAVASRMLGSFSESNLESDRNAHNYHMSLGLVGEVGELVDAVKKVIIYSQDPDIENIKEEIGDCLFYLTGTTNSTGFFSHHINFGVALAQVAEHYGMTLLECAEANSGKLEKRYPDGYTDTAAKQRADKEGGS